MLVMDVCVVCLVWLRVLGSASVCVCEDMWVGICCVGKGGYGGQRDGTMVLLLPTIMQACLFPAKHCDPGVSLQEEKWGSEPAPPSFPELQNVANGVLPPDVSSASGRSGR